ncbi:phage major capsid protein, P2 family [Asticcacaulis solisilvae]|uniref:phage major capsid protein, P2 family n=1 Tax=Asticcacaulis solisilvae TaxID=1217274 RepID=UPI003FD7ED5E
MRNDTRILFNQYAAQIALLNGVEDATEKFTVDPSVQQKLINKVQESSDFLKLINIVPVDELKGAILGLMVTGTLARRTDTTNADRVGRDPSSLDERDYECKKTDYDTVLKYAKLDMWAKFPDFQVRIQNMIIRAIALDMIRIGWNGTSAAATTNPGVNTNLEDVNVGWLQKLRTEKASQVMTGGAVANHVTYGTGGDYANLDALVWDLRQTLLPTWAREDTGLVAVVGQDLLHDKYFPIVNQDLDPTEQVARDVILSTKRLGGLPAAVVPFFPNGKVLITRYDNLSIYRQTGKSRRAIIDNPKRDQIENYQSDNDSYVIEDVDYAAMAENIEPAA